MKAICQSCGMPLKKDPQQGGTEKGGNKSSLYCSYCYEEGQFKGNVANATEMQSLCINEMMKGGTPRILAWLLTRGIPKLMRWK